MLAYNPLEVHFKPKVLFKCRIQFILNVLNYVCFSPKVSQTLSSCIKTKCKCLPANVCHQRKNPSDERLIKQSIFYPIISNHLKIQVIKTIRIIEFESYFLLIHFCWLLYIQQVQGYSNRVLFVETCQFYDQYLQDCRTRALSSDLFLTSVQSSNTFYFSNLDNHVNISKIMRLLNLSYSVTLTNESTFSILT